MPLFSRVLTSMFYLRALGRISTVQLIQREELNLRVFGVSEMSYCRLPNDVEDMIRHSWKRSYEYGLSHLDSGRDEINDVRIREILETNENFIQKATPILDRLSQFVIGTGHIAILSDASGNIIYTVSDPNFEEQAFEIKLQVGANWGEQNRGTNAIGVALIEGAPVQVHGNQHFFTILHSLTCAASPVYSPTGELLGIINISGRKKQFNPYSLSLALMAADCLQNKFLIEEAKKEQLLTLKELEQTSNQVPFPLFSIDNENRIVRANQAAFQILGKDCIGREFKEQKGFVMETIADGSRKLWRSVAMYKHEEKQNHLYRFSDIVGSCPTILNTKALGQRAAYTDFPILLFGESGTGKELLAQSIHTAGPRNGQQFIAVNCSAIPDTLVESELFGYVRGAFTGANREGGMGKFEAANHGTIFLDEIGDMSLRAQSTLLRVLQEKAITPVGATQSKPIDVRVIAATNKDLPKKIREGQFRADLYYRIKGIHITLPSLRERSDVIELAEYLLGKIVHTATLSGEAKNKLRLHSWPGNVRELISVLIQASFLSEGAEILAKHIQLEDIDDRPSTEDDNDSILSLADVEMTTIRKSLKITGGNISKAAELLQIGRNTLYRKLKEYKIY